MLSNFESTANSLVRSSDGLISWVTIIQDKNTEYRIRRLRLYSVNGKDFAFLVSFDVCSFLAVDMIRYFESIPEVPKLVEGVNPASWMIEISMPSTESRMGIDLADAFARSNTFRYGERDLLSETCWHLQFLTNNTF